MFHLGDADGIDFSNPHPEQMARSVAITLILNVAHRRDIRVRVAHDLIAHAPHEEVIYLLTRDNPIIMNDTYARFPNLKTLSSEEMPASEVFPNPDLIGDERIFPSLQHVLLQWSAADDRDWSPLMTFLACRISSGNRLDTLVITHSHICPEVAKTVGGMVRELEIRYRQPLCPFGTCLEP